MRVFGGHKRHGAYGYLPAEMTRSAFPTQKDRSCVEERHGWKQHSCELSLVNRLSAVRPPAIGMVAGGVHLRAAHPCLNPESTHAHALVAFFFVFPQTFHNGLLYP